MALNGYDYRFVQNYNHKENLRPLVKTILYTFTNKRQKQYMVSVEQYENDVFIIKFHVKNHKGLNKYCNLTGDFDARRILYTCINISLEIEKGHQCASFGFIGFPTKHEKNEGGLNNTKRFRVYQTLALTFFSPDQFTHAHDPANSSYLMINKKATRNHSDLIRDIQKMFTDNYQLNLN